MSDHSSDYSSPKNFFLLGVKLIILNEKNEILVLKRSKTLPRPGGFDFPGGAVDKGESPASAAIRELHEETGISIINPNIYTSVLINESTDYAVILGFSGKVKDVHVKLSWEHQEYQWMTISDITATNLPELHKKLLDTFLEQYDIHD